MNIENLSQEELKARLVRPSNKPKGRKKPVSIEKGIYSTIRGSVDEDTLLIEPTEDELESAYIGVIDKVTKLLKPGGDYKIFCFIHLNSKQGPRIQTPGIVIHIEIPFSTFIRSYKESVMELENKYIGGEEYNEQQLILSRCINVQFHYQVWEKI
eukprot:TRINITY_DN158_c0_g1_i1.p1 TRINITY_DN158_c0_g1~~TRINITY_DN158_c0_g1_i1.p1  ORF type:complete len:155 (-),score=16.20 TRINITY_DN158_c0_g1_i1:138-602(-)